MNNSQKQSATSRNISVSSFPWSIRSVTTFQSFLGSTGPATILVLSTLCNPLVANATESEDPNLGSTVDQSTESIDPENNAQNQIEEAKAALEKGDPNDSRLRTDLGRAYERAGLYEKALEQFLWSFDEGPKHKINRSYHGVRLSYLLGDIRDLAEVYAPAMDALVVRRDGLLETILKNRRAYRRNRAEIDGDFASLARYVRDDDYIFSVFDQLKNDEAVDRTKTLSEFVQTNLATFDEHGFFDVIVKYVDMRYEVDSGIRTHFSLQRQIREESSMEQEYREVMAKAFIAPARKSIVNLYKILLATERLDDARYAAERVISVFEGASTYNALAAAGIDSNKPTVTNVNQSRKAVEMEPANAIFVNTLVKLLHATGETSEAVRTAKDFLSTGQDPENRSLIEDTLQDLQ